MSKGVDIPKSYVPSTVPQYGYKLRDGGVSEATSAPLFTLTLSLSYIC